MAIIKAHLNQVAEGYSYGDHMYFEFDDMEQATKIIDELMQHSADGFVFRAKAYLEPTEQDTYEVAIDKREVKDDEGISSPAS